VAPVGPVGPVAPVGPIGPGSPAGPGHMFGAQYCMPCPGIYLASIILYVLL
jgi:hypothetical protein